MKREVKKLQKEESDKLTTIINEIDNLDRLNSIEKAYTSGYIEGGKIRNKMIGYMLEKIMIRNKNILDLQLELKEFIEELKNE